MQSRIGSFIESLTNIGVGFIISMILAYWFLPLFGIQQDFLISLEITFVYTISSLIRAYCLRRLFNKKK